MRYNQDDQTFQTVSEGSSAGTVVGILVAVFVVLGVFAYWWFKVRGKKKKDTDVKTPPAATPAAPPPPPSSEAASGLVRRDGPTDGRQVLLQRCHWTDIRGVCVLRNAYESPVGEPAKCRAEV